MFVYLRVYTLEVNIVQWHTRGIGVLDLDAGF